MLWCLWIGFLSEEKQNSCLQFHTLSLSYMAHTHVNVVIEASLAFFTFVTEHWKFKMANFAQVCFGTGPFHDKSSPVESSQVMYLSLWYLMIQALACHPCFSAGSRRQVKFFARTWHDWLNLCRAFVHSVFIRKTIPRTDASTWNDTKTWSRCM